MPRRDGGSEQRRLVRDAHFVKKFVIQINRYYGLILLGPGLLFFPQFFDEGGQTLFVFRRNVIFFAKIQIKAKPFLIAM